MPIGKNAIKRVENGGYSKVETSAPDMEHSTVIANLDQQVEEKLIAPVAQKKRGRKPAAQKTAQPSKAAEPAKKSGAKKATTKKDGFVRVEVGCEMPYYLL